MEFTDSHMTVPFEIVLRIAEFVVWSGESFSGFGLCCKAAAAAITEAVAARFDAQLAFWNAVEKRVLVDLALFFGLYGIDSLYVAKYSDVRDASLPLPDDNERQLILSQTPSYVFPRNHEELVWRGFSAFQTRMAPVWHGDAKLTALKRALARAMNIRVCFWEIKHFPKRCYVILTTAEKYEELLTKYPGAGPLLVPGSAAALKRLAAVPQPERPVKRARLD
jgi:hypothetical protein